LIEPESAITQEPQVSAEIVARIGAGDRSAESLLVERYGRGLLFLLRRRTEDTELAKDLRQETFRIAIEKLRAEPIENPERLAAFLRGVAVNLVGSSWRKKSRQATTADTEVIEALAADDPTPFDELSRAQVSGAVRTLLQELTVARDREILTRLYLEEQDRETICATLGLDSVHFNRVLFRAKQRFRELLLASNQGANLRPVK
jgi:RNA polymerase sigma-70 factor (ECF subfamily)